MTTAQLVGELREALSPTLLAVIVGAENRATVDDWATGRTQPPTDVLMRLRSTYLVLLILQRHEANATIRAWFRGMNPELNDESPALVMRDDPERVLEAAQAFIDHR
jgi:hypothetical protein